MTDERDQTTTMDIECIMMALDDDVFKVPDSIPRFSKRQRHISRLSEEWPFAALCSDDFYDDLPYCATKEKAVHKGALAPLSDFNELHLRKMSTSTPFHVRSSESHLQDSGFTECEVSTTFSSSCTLNTTQDSGRFSLCSDLSDVDSVFPGLPLPRLSLESEFESCAKPQQSLSQDSDSAYESLSSQDTLSDEFAHSTDLDLASSIVSLQTCATPKLLNVNAFQSVLRKVTPTEPDRLIGRRMGRDFVDIVGELSIRNMSSILEQIVNNVEDEDLSSMSLVNKQWKAVCDSEPKSKTRLAHRREQHRLRQILLQKENVTLRKKRSLRASVTKSSGCLREVQTAATTPLTKPKLSTTVKPVNTFWKEASQLRTDESLRKCPKCSSPAKVRSGGVDDRAICTKCSHDFCIKCLRCYHGSVDCSVTVRKKSKIDSSVGSKKSKSNLRRL